MRLRRLSRILILIGFLLGSVAARGETEYERRSPFVQDYNTDELYPSGFSLYISRGRVIGGLGATRYLHVLTVDSSLSLLPYVVADVHHTEGTIIVDIEAVRIDRSFQRGRSPEYVKRAEGVFELPEFSCDTLLLRFGNLHDTYLLKVDSVSDEYGSFVSGGVSVSPLNTTFTQYRYPELIPINGLLTLRASICLNGGRPPVTHGVNLEAADSMMLDNGIVASWSQQESLITVRIYGIWTTSDPWRGGRAARIPPITSFCFMWQGDGYDIAIHYQGMRDSYRITKADGVDKVEQLRLGGVHVVPVHTMFTRHHIEAP